MSSLASRLLETASHRLSLHPGQMEVFKTKARFKVVVAGRRWGKTQLAKSAIVKEARIAKRLIWYVAPTYRMAKDILWEELVSSIPRKWVRKINEAVLTIRLVNGTTIMLKGADKPDTLRGVGLHYLVIDEFQDVKEDLWFKVLRPTLTSTRGNALIIGTPKSFNLLHRLFEMGQNEENQRKGAWHSWQFPTITSPFIPESEIEQAKADMDIKSFRQEFEASFETMSGRVYHAFDRTQHVGKYEFNPDLPLWIGQDFNIDPMSSVLIQRQTNGDVWIVDEIILAGSNVQEVCEELERKYWRVDQDRITIYPDPAGSQRGHARGESALDVFRDKGYKRLKYKRKAPPVQDRVNAVNRMFMTANGTIRMYVNETCKQTIKSLEQTIYKKGSPEVDKAGGFEHPADALGYPIHFEFPTRKPKIIGASI